MDESDESNPLTSTETEIKELLGLFDTPAFVRRGQDLEYALGRLHARCRHQRDSLLEMVRLRLRQWAGVATGPDDRAGTFAAPIAALWPLAGAAPPPGHSSLPRPPPPRRRARPGRQRDPVQSTAGPRSLDQLNLAPVNRMIDQYNRYYVLEKECVLGSARLAQRHFTPKVHVTCTALGEEYPPLPVPELLP